MIFCAVSISAEKRSGAPDIISIRPEEFTPKSSSGKFWSAPVFSIRSSDPMLAPSESETRSSYFTSSASARARIFSGLGYFLPRSISLR